MIIESVRRALLSNALIIVSLLPCPRIDASEIQPIPDCWVWGGVPLDRAEICGRTLYVHQGWVGEDRRGVFVRAQGLSPHEIRDRDLVLVYRLTSLPPVERWMPAATERAAHWVRRGSRVVGIQLDFDSATARLGEYARWLRLVRTALPTRYRLSVTGLADWSTQGDPLSLTRISKVVDEVVFQLYRGRSPIPLESAYLNGLARLDIPFKLGLLPGMDLGGSDYKRVRANPSFRGSVVFLQKE